MTTPDAAPGLVRAFYPGAVTQHRLHRDLYLAARGSSDNQKATIGDPNLLPKSRGTHPPAAIPNSGPNSGRGSTPSSSG